MSRPRSFDYDECRALHATGEWTHRRLAEHFGVSTHAISYALNPEVRAYSYTKQLENRVPCVDCGSPVFRRYRDRHDHRCKGCSAKQQAKRQATGVPDDALHCFKCDTWKPDAEFPKNRASTGIRRGRHAACRSCQTLVKREWRTRHLVECVRCGERTVRPDGGARVTGLCLSCFRESIKRPAAA